MKAEAQRIAIAQACGRRTDRPETGWHDLGCNCQECYPLPDYLNSLDAMHEAEILVGEKWPTYCANLLSIVEPEPRSLEVCHYWNLLHATAAQRAEAFLRTLNLWTK